MKLIIAVIQPEELPYIKEELLKKEIYKFTITYAKGQGKEIPVQDEYVNAVVEAITAVAKKDGDKGRGKIFILPIEECIRIRTGEKGSDAIG